MTILLLAYTFFFDRIKLLQSWPRGPGVTRIAALVVIHNQFSFLRSVLSVKREGNCMSKSHELDKQFR